MNKTFLISIIVPVYNVEEYLVFCIDSILRQTYKNYELILVDDGSQDRSGSICQEYADKYTQIKVIHQDNKGVSVARNRGLEIASGEWCCFVDSDDWVSPDYLRNFVDVIDADAQLVLQGFWQELDKTNASVKVQLPDKIVEYNYELVEWLENARKVHNGFLWHRLFRLDIIHRENVQFMPGISFAEDGWFFFKYLKAARHFVLTSESGYHYRIREKSLTSAGRRQPLSKLETVFCGYYEALCAFRIPEEKQSEYRQFVLKYMWRLATYWFVQRAYSDLPNKSQCLRIMNQLVADYRLDEIKSKDRSLLCMIEAIKWKDSFFKDILIKSILTYRRYKNKFRSHL